MPYSIVMISDSLRSSVMFWINCSLSTCFFHASLVVSSDGMEGRNRRYEDGPNQRQVAEKPTGPGQLEHCIEAFQ